MSFFQKLFGKDPAPSQTNKTQQQPSNTTSGQPQPASQQQQAAANLRAKHQDPLIASNVSSVFAPSSSNLNLTRGGSSSSSPTTHYSYSTTGGIPSSISSASSVQPAGNPRAEHLETGYGDIYNGEVQFQVTDSPISVSGAPNLSARPSRAATSASQSGAPPGTKAIPNGLGELLSDHGRHTYTGFFQNGQREGQGQLVTSKYMIWAFWKANQVDNASSVRLDSLETFVKYRGFVRPVSNPRAPRLDPNKFSSFSLWVAATGFVKEGWGEAIFPDGRHVFGRWENDELCGFGTQMTPDGERYIGMFHNGKFHGFGVLFLPNGAICEGDWLNGTFKNTSGSITVPNRCILTGHFNERTSFSKIGLSLLDAANHTREDIDTGLSFVTRAQYESLFFWATNAAILREESIQQVMPFLALLERIGNENPITAMKTLEKELRTKLVKTKRFDNALRVAQRVIFFQYGSCGSPSHVRSGCGRATLGVLPAMHSSQSGSATGQVLSPRAAPVKATPANQAIGWCETQKCGGCVHQGSGNPITPATARNLFDDMLSFSASCRKYWLTLLTTARKIRAQGGGGGNQGNTNTNTATAADTDDNNNYNNNEDEEDSSFFGDEMITDTDLLNIVSRASFDAIFGACRKLAINVFCHAFYFEQNAAEAALERLRDVTLNDVGINFARQSDDALFDIYADATRTLEGAFASQVPTEILRGLHRWSQCIDSATRETSEAAAGSADDLIPIHQFVLLRAKIPHLVPMTKLVSWLGEQPCFVEPTSAESFCLTTLQACVAMLHDLRSNIRDTTGVLQSPSALEARVDDTLSLLEDQGVPFALVRRAADYCSNFLTELLGHRLELLAKLRNFEAMSAAASFTTSQEEDEKNNNNDDAESEKKKESSSSNKQTKQQPQPQTVFLVPSEPLHIGTGSPSSKSVSPSLSPSSSNAAAASSSATRNRSNSSSVPLQSRPRGRSVTSAPVNKTLDEQVLHAVSLLLESVGCTLVIGSIPIADSFVCNKLVRASNVVVSSKKNNFGIKEAFSSSTSSSLSGGGEKWCFAVKITAGLLRSAPQLKIYATKLTM